MVKGAVKGQKDHLLAKLPQVKGGHEVKRVRPLQGVLLAKLGRPHVPLEGGGKDLQVVPKPVELFEGLAVANPAEPPVPPHGVEHPHGLGEGESAGRQSFCPGEGLLGQRGKLLPKEELEKTAGLQEEVQRLCASKYASLGFPGVGLTGSGRGGLPLFRGGVRTKAGASLGWDGAGLGMAPG
jgi:hypothetical protein